MEEDIKNNPEFLIEVVSGYAGLVLDAKKKKRDEFAENLVWAYPEFVKFLKRNYLDEDRKGEKSLIRMALEDGNPIVVETLTLYLIHELGSSSYREGLMKKYEKKGRLHPDPRYPGNEHKRLTSRELARIESGEKIARFSDISVGLHYLEEGYKQDNRAKEAFEKRDWRIALSRRDNVISIESLRRKPLAKVAER